MQTKKQSLIESFTNILIWYTVSVIAQYYVYPFFWINIWMKKNLIIWFIFTVISLARNYIIRRYYNKKHNKAII